MIQLIAAIFTGLIGILTTLLLFARYFIIAAIILFVIFDPYGTAHFCGSVVAAFVKPILNLF